MGESKTADKRGQMHLNNLRKVPEFNIGILVPHLLYNPSKTESYQLPTSKVIIFSLIARVNFFILNVIAECY